MAQSGMDLPYCVTPGICNTDTTKTLEVYLGKYSLVVVLLVLFLQVLSPAISLLSLFKIGILW